MTLTALKNQMPGRSRAPAFFVALSAACALALAAGSSPLQAQDNARPSVDLSQQQQQDLAPDFSVQPPAATRPVPGQLELSKLIWSTMAAVDHANQSGNYSVLRDISAQGFQINNNAAQLANVFANFRNNRIDLANTLLVPPTYREPAAMVQPDIFQVKGLFQLRPVSIAFDLQYRWEQGRWKLFGINLQPLTMRKAAASQ